MLFVIVVFWIPPSSHNGEILDSDQFLKQSVILEHMHMTFITSGIIEEFMKYGGISSPHSLILC